MERNEELGLDLAPFRSYDPAIGRWLQVDPFAEIMPSMTPYRFGFNNPVLWSDPLGLFESKEAAKAHAKENGIKLGFFARLFRGNKINENSDGTFEIVQGSNSGSNNGTSTQDLGGDLGVVTGTIVKANDRMGTHVGVSELRSQQRENNTFFTMQMDVYRDGTPLMMDRPILIPSFGVAANGTSKLGQFGVKLSQLPKLDATGKVHGVLPKIKDLGKYSKEEIKILYKELKLSVQRRIKVTSRMGRDRAHGQRQGAEQDLIKSIEKFLNR